jgi:hypothetical protein
MDVACCLNLEQRITPLSAGYFDVLVDNLLVWLWVVLSLWVLARYMLEKQKLW